MYQSICAQTDSLWSTIVNEMPPKCFQLYDVKKYLSTCSTVRVWIKKDCLQTSDSTHACQNCISQIFSQLTVLIIKAYISSLVSAEQTAINVISLY